MPVGVQGVQAWDRYAYVNNSPVKYADENGHWIVAPAVLIGAVVGAAIGYGAQVYSNYQNGYSGSEAWTQNIDYKPIVGGALAGAGAVLMAPVAVAAAGNGLVGAGLATGSTTLFSAGTTTLAASTTMAAAIYGGSQIGKLPYDAPINFNQGKATPKQYNSGMQLYRVHSSRASADGRWWTEEKPKSIVQWRIDSAVLPEWNSGKYISTLTVPDGSSVMGWTGQAGYQGGFYVGNASNQVYLPITPTKWIDTQPF